MTPLETLLVKLPDARKAGNGWSARCPAHDDRRARLSIAQGDDGTALLKCYAGCDWRKSLGQGGATDGVEIVQPADVIRQADQKAGP